MFGLIVSDAAFTFFRSSDWCSGDSSLFITMIAVLPLQLLILDNSASVTGTVDNSASVTGTVDNSASVTGTVNVTLPDDAGGATPPDAAVVVWFAVASSVADGIFQLLMSLTLTCSVSAVTFSGPVVSCAVACFAILPWKTKTQFLLTLQVSTYFLLFFREVLLFAAVAHAVTLQESSVVQSQNAVSAHFASKQILPIGCSSTEHLLLRMTIVRIPSRSGSPALSPSLAQQDPQQHSAV